MTTLSPPTRAFWLQTPRRVLAVWSDGPRLVALFGIAVLHFAEGAESATRYFDVNGTTSGSGVANGGSYSWEGNFWNANDSAGTTATSAWSEGDFPRFAAGTDGSGKTYTISAASNHTVAGMQVNASGGTVNVGGAGIFTLPAGDQPFLVGTPTSQNLNINATLSGAGRINWQGTGSLFLLGNNTFTGGVLFNTSSGLNFNNDNSFGTGAMTWNVAQQLLAAPTATAPINIGNAMATRSASTLVMSSFAEQVTFTGPWTLAAGTSTLDVRSTADPIISGIISGANSTSALSKISPGSLTLTGANTYAGGTSISAGTLKVAGSQGKLGTGDVTASGAGVSLVFDTGVHSAVADTATVNMTNGATMTLNAGVNDALGNASTLKIAGGSIVNLAAGVNERIGTLFLDTAAQPAGTYGSSQSAAVNKLDLYFSGTGILTVGPAILAGDFNNNGVVDAADYAAWRANVGQPSQTLPNDTTGVIIGDAQYNLWRSNFGSTTAVPAGGSSLDPVAVPEPMTSVLLLLGLALLRTRKTRRAAHDLRQDRRRR